MNEKPDPRTRLVAEVFNDDWASGPAAAFARRAAAHARHRRAVRQGVLVGSAVAAATLAALLPNRSHVPNSSAPASLPVAPAIASVPPGTRIFPAYEIISDDELMALLRDRPLLVLPHETGTKKFVLLAK